MEGFKDPTRLTRAAVIALYAYMVLDALAAVLGVPKLFEDGPANLPDQLSAADAVTIVDLLALLTCIVLISRWIYRTNANAHLFSDGMTISPGWAVGWYFIPFANLVKPYQAMKETWLASHYGSDWGAGEEPVMIRWWWLLWIVTNILSNVTWRMENAGAGRPAVEILDLINAGLNVALCLILIRLMQRIAGTQVMTANAGVFA
jgi:hypothetical protein